MSTSAAWPRSWPSPAGAGDLFERLDGLVTFVHLFDRGIDAVVRTDAATLARLFRVFGRFDEKTLDLLLSRLAELPEDELVEAAQALARLPGGSLRRMLRLAGRPAVVRLLGGGPAG